MNRQLYIYVHHSWPSMLIAWTMRILPSLAHCNAMFRTFGKLMGRKLTILQYRRWFVAGDDDHAKAH